MIQDLISDFEAQLYYSIRDIKAFAISGTTDRGEFEGRNKAKFGKEIILKAFL